MSAPRRLCEVRRAEARDIPGVIALCRKVYPTSPPWTETQLETHQLVFPEGQMVAVDEQGTIVGMAASLIILWDDYDALGSWRDFTASGHFTNHDPTHGRTLYGAEIMVDPMWQGHGVGSHLYRARQQLAESMGLLRIRAGARLPGYAEVSQTLSSFEYVLAVVSGRRRDPTLSFQLARGFHVFDVVHGYLQHDPESLGWAALIQWINPAVATPEDYGVSDPRLAAYMPRVAV